MINKCFKGALIVIGCMVLCSPVESMAITIDDVTARLNADRDVVYDVDYKATLPMSDDEIEYRITIYSTKTANDTLSDCNYRIEYLAPRNERGFASYFGGKYFQYDNKKLREYHGEWDSIPFKPQIDGGVQGRGLFVSLLPSKIASEINRLRRDSCSSVRLIADTLIAGSRVNAIVAIESRRGLVMRELLYSFNRETGAVEYMKIENNPGSIGEQSINATFRLRGDKSVDSAFYSEAGLIKDYPEEFEKYRVSNFSIENLAGRRLPDFALATTTRERYTWDGGFKSPTIIVFLDSAGGMTTETIKQVRSAVAEMPITADVIWVFTGRNLDQIGEVMPSVQMQETALIGGGKFAGECGVTGCPTMLLVGTDGIVKDVQLGFNKDIKNVVIQKMTMF